MIRIILGFGWMALCSAVIGYNMGESDIGFAIGAVVGIITMAIYFNNIDKKRAHGNISDYDKRADELFSMGQLAGTMVLSMKHDKLTELFLACSHNNIVGSWSKLYSIAAAGYSYLESPEMRNKQGHISNGPIITAIKKTIQTRDHGIAPMLDEYFHFIKHFRDSGVSNSAVLSASFITYHIPRMPAFPQELKPLLEDAQVMSIIGGTLESQFKRYWW